MDNSRSMVEMHSGICEDIAGNSTNISSKPEAPGSSPGRRTKSAVISSDRGVFLLIKQISQLLSCQTPAWHHQLISNRFLYFPISGTTLALI